MAMLTSRYKEGEREGIWGYECKSIGRSRINKEGVKEAGVADGYLDQSQENWVVLHDKDPHLNLNSFRTKVDLPTGARSQWKLTCNCTACHNRCIMIYECERRYLQDQAPFR